MHTPVRIESSLDRPSLYQHMPLLRLIDRIVQYSDRQALTELSDYRILYRSKDKTPYRLAEYIDLLCRQKQAFQGNGYDNRVLEMAYDLTVDKFSNLPQSSDAMPPDKQQGPDCRHYFMAFLHYVRESLHLTPDTVKGPYDELTTTNVLRNLVTRHFDLSCQESERYSNELVRRYAWKVNGRTLYVWLPRSMPGQHCRRWLEENIPQLDPTRPNERERVQALINQRLPRPRMIPLHRIQDSKYMSFPEKDAIPISVEQEVTVKGLAAVVAQEKADNIHLQRPAIRRLGKAKLSRLILEVFHQLAEGLYQEKQIAASFGLSHATLSRFAGCRWNKLQHDKLTKAVPDLWRNTAQTLSGHSRFVAAARSAQVWKRVSQISRGGKQ